jgi:uncharacterized protein YllA (UPF0747 family)
LKATGLDVRGFPWIRPLAGDYVYNFKQVEGLYAGDPMEPEAWREAVARAQQKSRDRQTIVSVLQAQQDQRGASPAARAAAARLADPASVAVVTGQQAGVFGGPLYTLLKALTAIQLARRTERDLGVPVVPIFWVEAEDHDWEEIKSCRCRCRVPAAHLTLAVPEEPASGRSPALNLTPVSNGRSAG